MRPLGPATTRSRFSQGLSRQVAARGGLDDLYKLLSDHWTTLIQELYPVWIIVGPGLASPAQIDVHSRTVYLDSDELIGSRAEILAGQLDRYRLLVCFGAAFHEVGHAKHTLRFVDEYDKELEQEAQHVLARDRELLEEPRMEAWLCRDYPAGTVRGHFIRTSISAAVATVILPRFAEQVAQAAAGGSAPTRDMCGRAMTYLAARTHYGTCDPQVLSGLEPIWEQVLGLADIARLHDLYARLIDVPDGEIDALSDLAREYRDIIGEPDPEQTSAVLRMRRSPRAEQPDGADPNPNGQSQQEADSETAARGPADGDGGGDGELGPSREDGSRDAADGGGEEGPSMGSLADALAHAAEHAQSGQLEQLNEDVRLSDVLARAGDNAAPGELSKGTGTGAPSGRMPNRPVDRPPMPDEIRAAERFATELERARTPSRQEIEKRTPGGRFHSRQYMRASAQRRYGLPVTAHPWSIDRRNRNPIDGPHVIFIVDTSGSMYAYEYALGPIVWIIDSGLRKVGGRMATALFGSGAELLSDGTQPMRNVPSIRTGGGTAFAGDAIVMCTDTLEMEDRSRPRLAYILSDGGWWDTAAGMEKIRWLGSIGVPTIHISLMIEPLSVLAARISVIHDPADALTVVAKDSVALFQNPAAIPAAAAHA
jgi:hypothetical protein